MADQNHALVAISNKLNDVKPQLASVIPTYAGTSVEKIQRMALSELRRNPKLLSCDPLSFCDAVMQSARYGIEPGGPIPLAYLIPYGRECKLMFDYKGLIKVALRSPHITSLYAKVVFDGDVFEVSEGTDTQIVHKRQFKSIDPIIYYAVATLASNECLIEVMTKDEMDAHRKSYTKENSSAWEKSYNEMAKKTVLRRLMKYLPLNEEAKDALEHDASLFEKPAEPKTYAQVIDAEVTITNPDEEADARKEYLRVVEQAVKQGVDVSDLGIIKDNKAVAVNNVADVIALTQVIKSRLEAK